jgi:hypothetical protein
MTGVPLFGERKRITEEKREMGIPMRGLRC